MAQIGQATLDWAKHEGEIRDLFVSQKKTLNEVMAHMREKHNFEARYIIPLSIFELLDHQANNTNIIARGSTNPSFQSLRT
jgi:hypothetical protein